MNLVVLIGWVMLGLSLPVYELKGFRTFAQSGHSIGQQKQKPVRDSAQYKTVRDKKQDAPKFKSKVDQPSLTDLLRQKRSQNFYSFRKSAKNRNSRDSFKERMKNRNRGPDWER